MMASIYSSAFGVIAWLGDSTAESEIAFDYIDMTRSLRQRRAKQSVIQRGHKVGKRAIADLISRPYWGRLWIIQEVLLAQNLWVMAGSRSSDWDDLSQLVQPGHLYTRTGFEEEGAGKLSFKSIKRLKRGRPDVRPMKELVRLFHTALCQDPRDKLYGLLALADESARDAVRVDYEEPILQVFAANYDLWSDETDWSSPKAARTRSGYPALQTIADNNFLWSGRTNPCPREAVNSASRKAHNPAIFINAVDAIYSDLISELDKISQDPGLRSKLTTEMIFQADFEPRQTSHYQTFAAVEAPGSTIVWMTPSEMKYSVYVSEVSVRGDGSPARRFIVYTTALPEDGDVFLHLSKMVIILRPIQMGLDIVGTGVTVHGDGLSLPDPGQWFRGRIPGASYALVPESWSGRYLARQDSCHVRLNGPAIAELLRSECGADIRPATCKKWDAKQFIKEHGLAAWNSENWDYEEHGLRFFWQLPNAWTKPTAGPGFQSLPICAPPPRNQDASRGQSRYANILIASTPGVVSQKRKREPSPTANERHKVRKTSSTAGAPRWYSSWFPATVWTWLTRKTTT
ncbi:hypothetical protein AYL99_09119 [Fonsecaea erecta]|uniref:Heterokaryon incompatibility domain-containing protein n=1 Tax=Fonsecaea erecta TaxID=1367422 RepID=A0A178ZB44_9EURO|nr:hypothetical protein AYL99_09119 [Fonsecaea erecta]OAP57007.1 hypothetical protein AYL99_09119 [Fonsecaea erecta]